MTFSTATPHADAAERAFGTPRFSLNAPGDIVYVSNTAMTCTTSTNCTSAQTGTNGAFANNQFTMNYVDVDSDASTFQSSSALLDIPASATIEFAGLYWGGSSSAAAKANVQLETPSGGGYQPITASQLDDRGNSYQGFRDITSIVSAAGTGTYTVADINSTQTRGRYAGWTIVVVFSDTSEPWRSLSVFDGFQRVSNGNPVDITVSGFLTPPIGPVNASIGMVAYEGDNRYSGDFAEFEGVRLGDSENPTGNFFNSKLTDGGVRTSTGQQPDYFDQLGYDAKIIDTVGLLGNSESSADVTLSSSGDVYYLGAVTTAIEIYVPDLTLDFDKSYVDNNGGDTVPGDTLTYTLEFSNQGDDPALNASLIDPLPANVAFVPGSLRVVSGDNIGIKSDAQNDGDTAWFDGSNVVFNLGSGASDSTGGTMNPFSVTGTSYVLEFQVEVLPPASDTVITNQAQLSYTAQTIGEDYTLDTKPVDTPVLALADLEFVSKVDDVDPVTAGETVSYTFTVANNGPSTAVGSELSDSLPAGFSFTPTGSSLGCSAVGQLVTCPLGDLPPGSFTYTVAAIVSGDQPSGTVTNNATLSTVTNESDDTNNGANETTGVGRLIDLAVTKTASPTPTVEAGAPVTYVVTVGNNGPSSASNVQLDDVLPAGASLVSATASGAGSCATLSGVSCTWPTIAVGGSETVTIIADTDPTLAAGATLPNSATATADEAEDPAGATNTGSASTTTGTSADLQLTKSATTAAVPGETILYTVAVENLGPSDSQNVVVTDTLPSALTFDPASSSSLCTALGQVVTCSANSLDAAGTLNFIVGATIASTVADSAPITNTADVTADTSDPDPLNNADADTTAATREVDLSLNKSDGPDPVATGSTLSYNLAVTNSGPSDAASVTVTDVLPAGTTFNPTSDPRCSHAAGTVTCAGASAVGAGVIEVFTIVVDVDPGLTPGVEISNTADAASPETDPNPLNNSSTTVTATEAVSELEVSKDDSIDPATAGSSVSYAIEVSNVGPSPDTNVVVTDDLSGLPLTVDSVVGTGCTESAGIITCALGDLSVGESETITVAVTLDEDIPTGTQFTNTVTADGDNSPAKSAQEQTSAQRLVDLQLSKTGPLSMNAGDMATWTVTALNAGPSQATNVVLTDLLPPSVTYQAHRVITGSTSCVDAMGTLTCSSPSLAANATIAIEIDALVPASLNTGDTFTNKALITSDDPEVDPSSNTASVDTDVVRSSDLAIDKTADSALVVAGEQAGFSITVANVGPSDSTAVTVTDVVPVGLTFNATDSTATCSETGGTVTCALGDLQLGASGSVDLVFDVDPGASPASDIDNTASVTAVEPDPVSGNDDSTATVTVTASADLSLVKSSPIAAPVPGTNYTYTLTATNQGPSNSTSVEISDPLPAGASFVSSSPAGCTEVGGVVQCSLANVAAGGSTAVDITLAVADNQTGDLVNTAAVSAAETDPDPVNNSATSTRALVPQADLSITKLGSPDPVIAGEPVTWTIDVRNDGPSVAAGVVVSDSLDPSLSYQSASPACSFADPNLDCNLGSLAVGETQTVTVTALTDSAAVVGTQVANTATVSSDAVDPALGNNQATAKVRHSRSADLRTTKTATPDPVAAGGQLTYTITVFNDGPSEAASPNVVDTLPLGMTANTVGPVGAGGCGVDTTGARDVVTCGSPTLAAGDSIVFEMVVDVDSGLSPAVLSNSATAGSAEPDPDPLNDTGSADVEIVLAADLRVTKSVDTSPVFAGEGVSYTVRLDNDGPSDATGAVITDPEPAGMVFDPANSSSTCSIDTLTREITCPLGDVAAGSFRTRTLAFIVDANVPATSSLDNVATAAGNEIDPDPANDDSTAAVAIEANADLGITKVADAPPVPGATATWTISAINAGPSDSQDVVISDPVPTGATFNSGLSSPGCSLVGSDVVCLIGTLAPNTPTDVDIAFDLDSDLLGQITNSASITASTPDANVANDDASATDALVPDADLAVAKSGPATAVPGESVTYTLDVQNLGPSDAASVNLEDPLPAGTTFNAALSDPDCGLITGTIVCGVGPLAAASTDSFVVVLDIESGQTGSLINNATYSSGTADSNAANDIATTTAALEPSADLQTTKVPATVFIAGTPASYEITVLNNGPSDALAVEITDPLPTGLTFDNAGSDASCGELTGDVICSIGDIISGASTTVTIAVLVDAAYVGDLANTATASSPTPDPEPLNNDGVSSLTVGTSADLVISKAPAAPTAVPGDGFTWTVDVENLGDSDALNVVVTDSLPAGTIFDPATSSPQCSAIGSEVSCDLGTLQTGDVIPLIIGVSTDSGATGTLSNSASVVSSTPDPIPTNNSSIVDVPWAPLVDLSIAKAVSPDPVVAGEQVTYTLTVDNAGPSDALTLDVSDQLPLGLTLSPTGTDSDCSADANQLVTCIAASLIAGDSTTFRLVADIESTLIPGSTLSNTATVASATAESDGLNNTATVDATVARSADIAVAKTVTPNPVVAGQQASYTITVTNSGPSAAANVTAADALPAGLSVASFNAPTGVTCTSTTSGVSCDLNTLAVGASVDIDVVADVDSGVPSGTALTNAATASSAEPDPAPGNNSADEEVTVLRATDLSATKTLLTSPIVAGEPVLWSVTARNDGPSEATNVLIVDALPTDTTFNGTLSSSTCATDGTSVQCGMPTLPVGQEATFIVATDLASTAPAGGTLSNEGSVSSDEPDPNGANNTSTASGPIARIADLAVVKQGPIDAVVAGTPATFTLAVTNNGPSQATGVSVSDALPAGFTYDDLASSTVPCDAVGQLVTCTAGTIEVGDVVFFTVGVDVAPAAVDGALLANNASVTANEADDTPGNDSSVHSTQIRRSAGLTVVKTDVSDPVVAGTTVTWQLELINRGPSDVIAAAVTDTLPAGTTFSPSASSPECVQSVPTDVVCTVAAGELLNGESETFTIVAYLDPSIPEGTALTNAATADGEGVSDVIDDAEETTVHREIDLSLTKTSDSDPIVPGVPVTYTVLVSNAGPSDASGVEIIDTLPIGATVLSISDPACVELTGLVTCDWGDLGASSARSFTVELLPASYLSNGDSFINQASVFANEPDVNAANDQATVETPVSRSVDLSIVKTPNATIAAAGELVTYTLAVSNAGPSFADDVVVSDIIPAGMTFDAAASSVSCDPTVSCLLGTLADGETVSVTIAARIDSSLDPATVLTNSASVSSQEPNTNPDPTASVDVTVDSLADLEVSKVLVGELEAGLPATFEVTLTNNGPSQARNVAITDVLVNGLVFSATDSSTDCSATDQTVECDLGTVDAAEIITLSISVDVAPDYVGTISNSAAATSDTPDPDRSNNVSTAVGTVEVQADLEISKTASVPSVVPGGALAWTIEVVNLGPAIATDVVITDELPASFTAAEVDLPTCDLNGSMVECGIGDLAVGERVTVSIEGTIAADADIHVANTAAVASTNTDPDPTNNSATVLTPLELTDAQVRAVKTVSVADWVAGGDVVWTVAVTNDGPENIITPVVISDPVPGATTVIAATSTDGSCSVTGQLVVCSADGLASGATTTVTIRARLASAASTTIDNDATIAVLGLQGAQGTVAVSAATNRPQSVLDLAMTGASSINVLLAGLALLTLGSGMYGVTRRRDEDDE